MRLVWIILCLFLWRLPVFSQTKQAEIEIQDFIEQLFQVPDEDINYDDLYESLYQLYSNPIDLNTASYEELSRLYQLDIQQVINLTTYIENNRPLLSIYELQTIEGFDQNTIQSILPFIKVRSPSDVTMSGTLVQRIANEENNYLILRAERVLEEQDGFLRGDSSQFQGSKDKIYGRFRSSRTKDFSLGLTFEKDAGEQVSWKPKNEQYGFDYYSPHFFLEEKGKFHKIALGDYQMQFGQGLVFGAGFNPGKGGETITSIKRNSTGLSPYTSVLESGYMRGVALTYSLTRSIYITPFYSRIKQDALVRTDSITDQINEYISGIQDIGLHRNYDELESKNQITEQTYGLNITYDQPKLNNIQAGLNFINTQYSLPLFRTANNYNQFEFQGTNNYVLSLYANYNWRNFLFFTEGAQSKSGGKAIVTGFLSSLSPKVSLSFSLRNYAKDYHSFYGNSLGEGSRNINESGIYWGVKITPSRKLAFSAFYDYFKFPWLRFRTESPSDGYEFLLRADFKPTKKINMYAQMRQQSKALTVSEENQNLSTLASGVKKSYIGNLDLSINDYIALKSRIQFSTYDLHDQFTHGLTIIQDFTFSMSKLKISTRYAIFDTEDYENRQYVYEKDVLYAFSIPAYNGTGARAYILTRYKVSRKLTLWAKYGRYLFQNTPSIGSGLNEIEGNLKSEIKFQLKYTL